ncbi:sensor histidine kinase [Allopontixanthobacter sp.]|uniref:sensor histidine kinase n=1 Tax=Allopontixanthobacter sp. TaxID=2906452 RepID=UPI002AB9EEC3|nr:CHASE3 domain-containing protein [Allopontixanthobacter sp.]MDZ4307131.1 CHASE3 domain-containing protein [Allopontixanthobacter sp.]
MFGLGSRNSARWSNFALLGIIGFAMIAGMLLVFETIAAERAEREQVRATNEVLTELRNVGNVALNAETGQRGYLITLDRRYLEPYETGRQQYQQALDRLRRAVGPDASARQLQLLDRIENLTLIKFSEMDESVALLRDGELLDARTKLLSDEGQEAMVRLRHAIREMEQIEGNSLDRAGAETARAEGRVLPLLSVVMALLLVSLFLGYHLVIQTARAEARAEQSTALAEARDRADLLAHELNHRVKNLFAVILAIVSMSARDEPEAKPMIERISNRIRALLTAHEVTQGTEDQPPASLRNLVETTLAPYRSETLRAEVDGPETLLPSKHITPLGLVLHELTTNAVKYGAWASGGMLAVRWEVARQKLNISWKETCEMSDGEPERQGFGSMLMNSAARQLGGTIDRSFTAGGVAVLIVIPLEE